MLIWRDRWAIDRPTDRTEHPGLQALVARGALLFKWFQTKGTIDILRYALPSSRVRPAHLEVIFNCAMVEAAPAEHNRLSTVIDQCSDGPDGRMESSGRVCN